MTDVLLLMYLIYIITLWYLLGFNLFSLELAFEKAMPTRPRSEAWQGVSERHCHSLGAPECHLCKRTQPRPSLGTMHRATHLPVPDGYQVGWMAAHEDLTSSQEQLSVPVPEDNVGCARQKEGGSPLLGHYWGRGGAGHQAELESGAVSGYADGFARPSLRQRRVGVPRMWCRGGWSPRQGIPQRTVWTHRGMQERI